MKHIIYTIILVLIIMASVVTFVQTDEDPQITNLCAQAQSRSCCEASASAALAPGNILLEDDALCPDSMRENMMKCMDTLRWCEPVSE